MNLPDLFYEIIGYSLSLSRVLIVLLFLTFPLKIKTKPFGFYFTNCFIVIILDFIAIYLHVSKADEIYFYLILPLLCHKIIYCYWEYFFSYSNPINIQKYYRIVSVILAIMIGFIYIFSKATWTAIGSSFQSVSMIVFLLISISNSYKSIKKNQKSVHLIALGLLFAYSFSMVINFFYGDLLNTDTNMAHMLYGIKNIFWILSNIISIYAIYILKAEKKSIVTINSKNKEYEIGN